jgi:hypothetical protein
MWDKIKGFFVNILNGIKKFYADNQDIINLVAIGTAFVAGLVMVPVPLLGIILFIVAGAIFGMYFVK